MSVPLLDLQRQHKSIKDEVGHRVRGVIEEQDFILGEPVKQFERSLAEYHGVDNAVSVNSGTDALLLALRALDIGDGDEVITTPFTFFATAGAVHNVGAQPVFVDVDPETYNLDVDQLERAITSATEAILPVHLFGQMADIGSIRKVADEYDLAVIEDAAQAVGAGRMVAGGEVPPGQVGDVATLSFFPAKNLGAWGDGGAILTNDSSIAKRIEKLRVHGGRKMYHHEEVGVNSRLDTLQAAVLEVKLNYLDDWNAARAKNAAWYQDRFASMEDAGLLTRPRRDRETKHVWHQYTVRVNDRDELCSYLERCGIGTGIYYPVPLHLQPCFSYLGYDDGDFPQSESAADDVLSLPVFPELSRKEQREVADTIEEYYQ